MIFWAAILPALLAYGLYDVLAGSGRNDEGDENAADLDLPEDLESEPFDREEARAVVGSDGDDRLDGTAEADRIAGGAGE